MIESAYNGLSEAEAAERLRVHGPNELAVRDRRHFFRILRDAFREPMLLLLLGTTALYFALGDIHEGLMLAALTVVDVGIVAYQDLKTERVLETLRDLASPRALVVRDGVQKRIAGRDVVPGDIMIVSEGDRVAADAQLLSASELKADESLLTGESVPVEKMPGEGGDGLRFVYSGTLIVHGQGLACVTATGMLTQFGRIGKSLQNIDFEEPRLRRATRRLTRDLAIVGATVSILVIALQGLRAGDWIAAILAGVTTAMSMMPEEIPVVLTVFLTLGAWRISRRHVLTRQAAAIENLGAATVLCTDKTGTLTVNRMTVTRVYAGGTETELRSGAAVSESVRHLLKTAALASEALPTDPMERAFLTAADGYVPANAQTPHRIYGLTPALLAVTYVRRDEAGGLYRVAAKGAPEAIASLCRLSEAERDELMLRTGEMAADGLRVLAAAEAIHDGDLPETPRGFAFRLLGLAGLSDPIRDTVPAAVAECRNAGIRVAMITGDYPVTARAIARQAGIDVSGEVVTGPQLAAMDDGQLAQALRTANVFARVMPEQKLRIVTALKAGGEIVAMTGDGVNDAPALKAANIGIAMGGRGSDVAREAAALVLLDDAFESIVAAIRLGRRIFDNLRKALSYVFAVHVPIAGIALAPLLLGWPIVFSPVHIVFLELIIDPVCSIVFEAEHGESDIMLRPPRAVRVSLFERSDILVALARGLIGLLGILAVYAYALGAGVADDKARAIAFAGIVTVNLALILASRSRRGSLFQSLARSNPILWLVLFAATGMLLAAVYAAPLSGVFLFAPLAAGEALLALIPAVALLAISETMKGLLRRREQTTGGL